MILSSNLKATLDFYAGILGFSHECEDGKHALKFANSKINIHEVSSKFTPVAKNRAVGSADFCLIADGDIEKIKSEILANGGKIALGVVERNGAKGVMKSIYLYDPDGNLVEIAVYEK